MALPRDTIGSANTSGRKIPRSVEWGVLGFLALVAWLVLGAIVLSVQNSGIDGPTGDIWNAVQRANDLLPQLQGQLTFTTNEQEKVVKQITIARNDILAAQQTGNLLQAANAASKSQFAFNAVAEDYPDFGISKVQAYLATETAGSINRIAYARHQLIQAQVSFNQTRVLFPLDWLFFPRKVVLGSNTNPQQNINVKPLNGGSS